MLEPPPGNAPRLTRGLLGLFELLREHSVGDVLDHATVLAETGWSESSLKTYERKNKLAHLLARRPDGDFDILRGGSSLREADIQNALSQVTPEALQLHRGERLSGRRGTYVLKERRGTGAVGHVWEALDDQANHVAIKIVNPRADLLEPTVFPDVKQRFVRESRNGMKLNHPSIIEHKDLGSHRRHPFLVLELADRSMRDLLETAGPLSITSSAETVLSIALGLKFLHDAGCVHRDVKPSNVLECGARWKLADMGITKWSDLSLAFTSAATITREAVQLGSMNYMSPEQRDDPHAVTSATDVYSLGVTWYLGAREN